MRAASGPASAGHFLFRGADMGGHRDDLILTLILSLASASAAAFYWLNALAITRSDQPRHVKWTHSLP
jgi:hypothetical protein